MDKERWTVPNLTKNERERLQRRSLSRASVDLLLRLGLQAILLVAALQALNAARWALALPLVLASAMVWSFMGWSGIGHECFHRTVFPQRRLNVAFFRVFSVLTWNNYAYFEVSHWRHHKRTMWDDDPETQLECHLEARELPWLLSLDIPRLVRRWTLLAGNAVGHAPPGLAAVVSGNEPEQRKVFRAARVLIGTHVLLAISFIAAGQPWLVLLVCLAPFTFSLPIRVLEVVQHCGLERNVWDYRRNTRTVLLDPFFGFLYANMNYHVEHHMFPAIPYYHLPSVRRLLIQKRELEPQAPRGFRTAFRISLDKPLFAHQSSRT